LCLAESDPRHPLRVILASPGEDPLARLESQASWSDLRAGVILAGVAVPRTALRKRLAEAAIPLVLLGEASPAEGLPWVQSDQVGSGRQAAQHLAGHGRRRLALIDGPWSHPPARQMREGFLAAAEALGIEASAHEAPSWDRDQSYRVAHTLIAGTHPPDGLVVAGDLASSGALAALHERGVAIPAAVAVVVVGLVMRSAQLGGATAFMLDIAGHAQAALALLADPRPGVTLVPNRLLPGTTCGCPRPRR
jgi:DNA-binding LacI/PurR family transcriptional regulator